MWGGSVAAGLVAYAVNPVRGNRPHREFPRSWSAGDTDRTTLAPQLAALADRYAPPAVLLLGFHQALDQGDASHRPAVLRRNSLSHVRRVRSVCLVRRELA